MDVQTDQKEREGVVRDEASGDVYLPATKRADGSWRKPRRVKDGYIPQEEVPVYENQGVQWMKNRPTLPPGLSAEMTDSSKGQNKDSSGGQVPSKSALKNQKRKEKKQKAQAAAAPTQVTAVEEVTYILSSTSVKDTPESADKEHEERTHQVTGKRKSKSKTSSVPCESESVSDPAKRLKNLKKKLKQIQDLKERLESGQVKEPQPDQLEKVAREEEVLKEIEELEVELQNS